MIDDYEPDPALLNLAQRHRDLAGLAVRLRIGEVTDDDPLSVALGGSSVPLTGMRAANGARPAIGDIVAVLSWGNDRLVLGTIGGGSPRWTTPTFRTNYVDYGATDANFRVGYHRDAIGVVRLRGYVSRVSSSWTNGDVMFNLPAGWRPQQTVNVGGVAVANGTPTTTFLRVTATGDVIFIAADAAWGGATNVLALDNVSFLSAAA